MRWIWIDKFIEVTPLKTATALKNVTLAEEHLHDLYPDFPIVPHSLLVEGMAQTSGLLVGQARQFKEKVILAKVGKAVFHRLIKPGDTILFIAVVDQLSDAGASISGRIEVRNPDGSGVNDLAAEIELMFSHIDNNLSGIKFPEDNFVFTTAFTDLINDYREDNVARM
ncbi:MAG TPA: hypothetical protein VF595_11250 [Tepidisphaeraceae bacterium]|jgi:3-hydroxyacyl-[acyl-carrier-protein] dehydratase